MRWPAIIIALLTASPAFAASAVPASGIITEPGSYRLTASRVSTGAYNIQIRASDVDLDLDGWYVRCAPANPAGSWTVGVAVSGSHVTIRGGAISGCWVGVAAPSADMLTVSGVNFTGNTYMGLSGGGRGAVIVGNVFQSIGGYALSAYAVGINSPGPACRIERNTFRLIYRQAGAPAGMDGEGVGILVSAGQTGCVIRGNWIWNGSPQPNTIGIWLAPDSGAYVAENTVTNFDDAVRGGGVGNVRDNRFWMKVPFAGSTAVSGGRLTATGNLIVGFDLPLSSGGSTAVDGGGNLILP